MWTCCLNGIGCQWWTWQVCSFFFFWQGPINMHDGESWALVQVKDVGFCATIMESESISLVRSSLLNSWQCSPFSSLHKVADTGPSAGLRSFCHLACLTACFLVSPPYSCECAGRNCKHVRGLRSWTTCASWRGSTISCYQTKPKLEKNQSGWVGKDQWSVVPVLSISVYPLLFPSSSHSLGSGLVFNNRWLFCVCQLLHSC